MKKTRFTHSHADHHQQNGKRRFSRRQKNFFHFMLIVIIAVSLANGSHLADWLFLALAVAVEVS